MSLSQSKHGTQLQSADTTGSPVVRVEDASLPQTIESESVCVSTNPSTPGQVPAPTRKRKAGEDEPEGRIRDEADTEATISDDDDRPSIKKPRLSSGETGEPQSEGESTLAGETASTPENGEENGEKEKDKEADTLTDGGPSTLSKKRPLDTDVEQCAADILSAAPTVNCLSGSSSSETPSSSSSSVENQENLAHPTKRPRLDNTPDPSPPSGSAPISDQAQPSPSLPQIPAPQGRHNSFLTLPLELLAEILILTGSPKHVLAVARTCKALCTSLLSPDAQFIWREARKATSCIFESTDFHQSLSMALLGAIELAVTKISVTLPDPPKNFCSEAAYAAFVFDGGKCEFCQKETSLSYASFALRARICKDPRCANNMISTNFRRVLPRERGDQIFQLVPMNEGPFLTGHSYIGGAMWPEASLSYIRPEQANAAATMLLRGNENQEEIAVAMKRNEEWMKFCVELFKWNKLRVQHYNRMKQINMALSKQIASSNGWNYDDLCNTIYGPYQSRKTKLIEKVSDVDVRVMREEIESQLLALSEKRQRREAEISLMKNRESVEAVYNRLRSTKAYPYMPSLATFRELPVVQMLQSAERSATAMSIADALQNDKIMKELLTTQLNKWADKAKDDLCVVLGFPKKKWKTANKNILHPVERVTGRFLCKRCGCVEPKYRKDGCLDFAGACLHTCVVGNKEKGRLRKGKKAIWDASNFVRDEKAIDVLKTSISLLGHPEDRQAGHYLLSIGLAVVCMSCDPYMVLDSRSLIGHSHRHDKMKVSFSPEDIASYCGGFRYHHGLVQRLLTTLSFNASGKKEIDRKNYGCRHCLRQKQVADAAAAAAVSSTSTHTSDSSTQAAQRSAVENPTAASPPNVPAKSSLIELSTIVYQMHDLGIEGPLEKPPPLFNFNGMRSHLKAKHQIEEIRDEDMFCFRDPEILL